MEYRIGGLYFQHRLDDREYIGQCIIPRPFTALYWAYQAWPLPQLLEYGFSAFADGSNGDVWLMRVGATPEDEVFFLERTAWNGDPPSTHNGLIQTNLTFLQLLTHGVSWTEPED